MKNISLNKVFKIALPISVLFFASACSRTPTGYRLDTSDVISSNEEIPVSSPVNQNTN